MTGFCNCLDGFMGATCRQPCPNGTYGLGCASRCQCFTIGTRSCHHVNGSCDCLDSWTGELCEVEGIISRNNKDLEYGIKILKNAWMWGEGKG